MKVAIFFLLGGLALGKSFFSLDKYSLLDKFEENVVDSCMSEFVNSHWTVSDEVLTSEEYLRDEQAAEWACQIQAQKMRDTLNMTLRDE